MDEKLIPVSVIKTNEENALVEYEDKRVYIPLRHIHDGLVKPFILERGIQYGINFEEILKVNISSKDVARALHRNGIWTEQDIMKNPNRVISALQESLHLTLADLLTAIKRKE